MPVPQDPDALPLKERPSRARGQRWSCISGCGACCRLDPARRPEAIAVLDPVQKQRYLAMVGRDGWCIHFDSGSRRCRIYDSRPDFCRVSQLIDQLDDVEDGAADAWAISCCKQQIRSEYGGRDKVMKRFLRATRATP